MWLPPLTVGSPGTLGLPVRLLFPPCGCESARVLPSLLGPSPSGVCDFFLAFVPLLEAMSESLTHSFPRSFLVVALYASAVGFADALWLCPEHALRRLFASVSLFAPVALSPLLHRVFPDGFRLWCAFAFAKGRLPRRWFRRGPWGVAVAPPISPYTGPVWSPFCRVPWVLRSVFSVYRAAFRPYSWRSFGQFH